jgi:hypothetical protein
MKHNFKVGDIVEIQKSFVAKLERLHFNTPQKPIVYGKIKKIWKTNRPLGIELVGLKALTFQKKPFRGWYGEDQVEHYGLFWFRPNEVKKVDEKRMKQIDKKMFLDSL